MEHMITSLLILFGLLVGLGIAIAIPVAIVRFAIKCTKI